MPSSADAALDAVVETIIALERSCLDADGALVERRWTDLDAAFSAQTALTERLARLFASTPHTAPASDAKVARRVRGILAYRDDQLRRLRAHRDEVGTRLSSIGKVNAFSRSFGKPAQAAHLLDGQF
ncbi:MAG: hypothetical protein QOJ39_77 [Candidatus Eremiobacteraeota bacterium]|jgi:hypothetical protein|nr:hypothetical protein [Candidatus Eremiobacteraeota bacterium]MEA2718213.1 hypothetical protein [Candidatus Eremiobacteraeota bacterium]